MPAPRGLRGAEWEGGSCHALLGRQWIVWAAAGLCACPQVCRQRCGLAPTLRQGTGMGLEDEPGIIQPSYSGISNAIS